MTYTSQYTQIACVSPCMTASKETIRTLKFAVGVKGISNYPTIVLDPQVSWWCSVVVVCADKYSHLSALSPLVQEQVIKRLQDEIMKLRLENAHLRQSLISSPHPFQDQLPEGFALESPQPSANIDAAQTSVAIISKTVRPSAVKSGSFLRRIFALRGRTPVSSTKVEDIIEPSASNVASTCPPCLEVNIGLQEKEEEKELQHQKVSPEQLPKCFNPSSASQ